MADITALPPALPAFLIEDAVRIALAEDLGRAGDVTSLATIHPDITATAVIASRENGILSGIEIAAEAFRAQRANLDIRILAKDGEELEAGRVVMQVTGNARAIMSGERVALNYLCHLSGVATHTRRFVDAANGGARICCTRKTLPGLRAVEKYAVKCGGGANHRFGLDDAIMIKDNHLAVSGGIKGAVAAARAYAGHLMAIELEVDTLDQFDEALETGVEAVLLDNMSLEELREAVRRNKAAGGRTRLEASGNVDLDTVGDIAQTGVDFISTSKITMSARTLDLGLDIEMEG